jgi:subtilase family protein
MFRRLFSTDQASDVPDGSTQRPMIRRLPLAFVIACACLAVPAAASAVAEPNDPYFSSQWGLKDVNAPEAWAYSTGAGVTVAVVDTGVLASHPDLAGRVVSATVANGDTDGHGTQVAGVIAADMNNGIGVAGVAPSASVLPVRAFTDADLIDVGVYLDALDQAADTGARVVNASVATDPLNPASREALTVGRAFKKVMDEHPGTLFVAAAGQTPPSGNDNDDQPVFPCSTEAANLLCVGATQPPYGDRFLQSNYGAASVDLYAPGVAIRTTTLGPDYAYATGTSFAAPFVSGEAALLLARVPQLTPQQVIGLILSTVRVNGALAGKAASGGSADAAAALAAATVDSDGDGVPDIVDHCPNESYPTADGCQGPPPPPTPTPTAYPSPSPTPNPTVTPVGRPEPVPHVKSMTTKVSKCKTSAKSCKKSATVKVKPDRTAKVSLRVERRTCDKRRRCHWTRVMTKAFIASTRGKSVVVKRPKGLAKGTYRVVAVLSSSGGAAKPVTRTFTVR